MGTGGNNTPFVLISLSDDEPKHEDYSCYAIASHPMSSDIRISGNISSALTVKMAKLASDGPLALIRRNIE